MGKSILESASTLMMENPMSNMECLASNKQRNLKKPLSKK